jgi:arylsulfatase
MENQIKSVRQISGFAFILLALLFSLTAHSQNKPNILLIVGDDVGYGDLGPYGGGEGRGMATPNFDRIAKEGMTFFSWKS